MFESDDFDQVLSQFDFTDVIPVVIEKENDTISNSPVNVTKVSTENTESKASNLPDTEVNDKDFNSSKRTKRNLISSHFNHKTKRKFPGPAGLLTGNIKESKDEDICHIELLSQDIDYAQSHLRKDLFESPIWITLLDNLKSWNLADVDLISAVKQQAMNGNLRMRKAQIIAAFIETVDRSATDPLIMLRDDTGTIKCTLHRDAWSKFSPYIVAEYCALLLWKPTVLTTGSAFKKHYLNITLSNILAIYSSAILKEEEIVMPGGYSIIHEEDFTVIKTENLQNLGANRTSKDISDIGGSNLFDDLDGVFLDELF
ncbi:hypothetical protein K1T71_009757 [Dendrolimus kikuchii]|uniref:Uncharacterized protein n=1 Tax=Dendrolimus kikuchii TaxID=765133 RepID=A0ACC1CSJ6_9NEOP|nr:hypothetical protein K1T71_009757 [Dendrolimus kikuchii]